MAGRTLGDPLAEALRLIDLAEAAGIPVRLMGGLAFHALVPDWTARIDRSGRDIDVSTRSRDTKAFTELLQNEGYVADRHYNAAFGHKQLYFADPTRSRPVDVLVDRLEMCHTFEFSDRLVVYTPTLPLAELLLSKLQIVKINRKDILDALILLQEFPLANHDRGAINLEVILAHTSGDWGWWRTVTQNLDVLATFLSSEEASDDLRTERPPPFDLQAQISALWTAVDEASKSVGWKLRAAIGDRVTWYELPEEIGHR
jgi:hypothetical protein